MCENKCSKIPNDNEFTIDDGKKLGIVSEILNFLFYYLL